MKHRFNTIGVHLTIGFVMTIAIAWWAGLGSGGSWNYSAVVFPSVPPSSEGEPRRVKHVFIYHGGVCASVDWAELPEGPTSLPSKSLPWWCRKTRSDQAKGNWREVASGWPMRCLWKAMRESGPLVGAIALPDPRGIHEIWPGQSMRGLPVSPIWPGLIANVVFWAGLSWAAVAAIASAIHASRLRRGVCPSCAYDLRGVSGGACPECGHDPASD